MRLIPTTFLGCMLMSLAVAAQETYQVEAELIRAYDDWRAGDRLNAESRLSALTEAQPGFRLAQLIYGDVLSAHAGTLPLVAATATGDSMANSEVATLLGEARHRIQAAVAVPAEDTTPSSLVSIANSIDHAVVVDLEGSRLHVFENGENGLVRIADFYAGIGLGGPNKRYEGDRRTPVGVYFVTQHIEGDKLPDLYGIGAFPVNYPNRWDAKNGYGGSGIWLHGVPSDTYSRPPRSSRGCVTLANSDFTSLSSYIDIAKTPVVFSETIDWLPADVVERKKVELAATLETWRQDWESLDADKYLSHYSPDFNARGVSYRVWAAKKRDINTRKTQVSVKLSDITLLAYPGSSVFIADFEQDYDSNNYSGVIRKRQYWEKNEAGDWKIFWEGAL